MAAELIASTHYSPDYELIDSGQGMKLERFGSMVLARPSSLSIWKRRLNSSVWESAAATFDHKLGWNKGSKVPDVWDYNLSRNLKMRLRLQTNGQVGVFPEHDLYLEALSKRIRPGDKVLNLFAYTGMATLVLAQAGAQVTHLDLSKSAITWAKENLDLNKIEQQKVRFIVEDALQFIEKEKRRNNRYQMIIADPPGFSRVAKNDSWDLEQILPGLVENCVELLDPERGTVLFTAHGLDPSGEICANLLSDCSKGETLKISCGGLSLRESGGKRSLPASCYAYAAS